MIKVGLCGFSMAMAAYSKHFPVVEVQHTFYAPPSSSTVDRWLTVLPKRLEITLKAWQLITHDGGNPTYRRLGRPLTSGERAGCGSFRDTETVFKALETTLALTVRLSATAVLFQCPARFGPTKENCARLVHFFEKVANPLRPQGVRYLWEPRGPSWVEEARIARDLCAKLDLIHVIDPFVTEPAATRAQVYFRLHGISGARHVYTDEELKRLDEMTPRSGYVMFNNIPRIEDASRFQALVKRRRSV